MMALSRQQLQEELAAEFGGLAAVLLPLCLDATGDPLGSRHIEFLDNLHEPRLSQDDLYLLTTSYVYLASCFFCIDHVYDRDPHSRAALLAPSLLHSAAERRLLVSWPRHTTFIADGLVALSREFTSAMLMEKLPISAQHLRSVYTHVTGRSALFIFAYRLLCIIKGIDYAPRAIFILKRLLLFMQHGDDLGDWRADYRAGNITPTIAAALASLGYGASEEALEKYIYLSGFYESRCTCIVSGLKQTQAALRALFAEQAAPLEAYVERQIVRVEQVYRRFVHVKAGGSFYNLQHDYC